MSDDAIREVYELQDAIAEKDGFIIAFEVQIQEFNSRMTGLFSEIDDITSRRDDAQAELDREKSERDILEDMLRGAKDRAG